MPLLGVSLAFVLGISLAAGLELPVWAWAAGAALGAAWAIAQRRWRRLRLATGRLGLPAGILLALLCLGALRWFWSQPVWEPDDLAYYNDTAALELEAWVSGDPDVRENAVLLRVQVTALRLDGGAPPLAVHGPALVRLTPGVEWRYGDRLTLWGTPQTAPEDEEFSYRAYLAGKGIYTYLPYPAARRTGSGAGNPLLSALYALRQAAYRQINALLPQPEAGLLSGILLGMENDLPEGLQKAFQTTGTAHIIAISGFNLAILSALVIGFFTRFFRLGWASLLAGGVILLYTLLVGANPAVVRAALMASLGLAGRLIGRPSAGLTPLGFTAALMCAANPSLVWDASFQLSFTATLGLIVLANPLQSAVTAWAARRFSVRTARAVSGPLGEYVLVTLSAQVMTLPVVLVHFGRFSGSALLANALILPVQPLVMELGGAALVLGALWAPLGTALAWPLTAYTVRMVEFLAQLPGGAVESGPLWVGWAWIYYGVLLAGLYLRGRTLSLRGRLTPAALGTALALLSLGVWSAALQRPDGRLHVTLLESGPAVLVETGTGRRVLIGGGQGANDLSAALNRELSPFDRRLDAMLVTDGSPSVLGALPAVVERMRVRQVGWTQALPTNSRALRLQTLLEEGGIPAQELLPGAALQLDAETRLTVLAASGLRLDAPNLCVVWPGRAQPGQWTGAGGCVLVLSADHLAETSAVEWQALRPLAVLVSGAAVGPLPLNTYTTSAHGRIELLSDGQQVWLLGE